MASPILPSNAKYPTAQARRIAGANNEFYKRLRKVLKVYTDALDGVGFTEFTVNAYSFNLDSRELSNLFDLTGQLVDDILLEGGEAQLWFSLNFVVPAYQQGSSQTYANLSAQSNAYLVTRPTLTDLLLSQPYQTRLGLLLAREFENMKGFSATVKKNMAFVLAQGLATGLGPRAIAKNLTAQIDIEYRAAERIARTEVNNALRQARMDEAQAAMSELGISLRMMHLSALSPTTRRDHASRHGNIFTVQAQREWWSEDGNSINCKCSTLEVITDEDGNPVNPAFVEKVQAQGATYFERLAA